MTVTASRQARAILPLPGVVTVLVPILVLTATGTDVGWGLDGVAALLPVFLGLALLAAGFSLWLWTVRLFARIGGGTLAPWDPTRHLVVAGPYRHVRNPMISGVVAFLAGEAVLEERFGDEYRDFKRNVPRWLPRRTPWTTPRAGS